MAVPTDPILLGRNLGKRYGAIEALAGVDIALRSGEVTSLCGDNGAGKSTLVKILSGAATPTTGKLQINGEAVRLRSPRDAQQVGVETVFQDLGIAPHLTVTENVFLGREIPLPGLLGKLGMMDRKAMHGATGDAVSRVKINLPGLDYIVESMSGGQRQAVAVSRTIIGRASIVLLDEPTAALGVQETSRVADLIGRLRDARVAVLMISHDLPMVMELSDRVVILRHGRKVGDIDAAEHTVDDVIAYITGHKVQDQPRHRAAQEIS
ncbi:MAG TPA: ATP-binding cassette domain-containing protein [Solirubrobacteraceae bacterium]|jgi:simple sugar transport system ATP-binding protein|nr:ATP-binding cassette domain-containing protein [Solirubrobacteraceae bacterium]